MYKNIREYKEMNEHVMKKTENFKQRVVWELAISPTAKNVLIELHNEALSDEFYGERLYCKLMELE
jgi:hypothetical protein